MRRLRSYSETSNATVAGSHDTCQSRSNTSAVHGAVARAGLIDHVVVRQLFGVCLKRFYRAFQWIRHALRRNSNPGGHTRCRAQTANAYQVGPIYPISDLSNGNAFFDTVPLCITAQSLKSEGAQLKSQSSSWLSREKASFQPERAEADGIPLPPAPAPPQR